MNEKELLQKIAGDLGIVKYRQESDGEYMTRVIYTAMGQWLQTVVFDKDVESEMITENCRTLQYISQKCRGLLSLYIVLYPGVKDWFYPRKTVNPIRAMYLRYVSAGVLVSGPRNTYQLGETIYGKIATDLYYVRGSVPVDSQDVMHYGLGTFVSSVPDGAVVVSIDDLFGLTPLTAYRFASEYVESVLPNMQYVATCPESREYFDVLSMKSFSSSWEPTMDSEWDVTIYRNNRFDDYGLAKYDGNRILTYPFPKYMTELHETKRLMYGLRAKGLKAIGKTQFGYTIDTLGDYVKLSLYSSLPKAEETLFHQLAWPVRSIDDRSTFITSAKFLPLIRSILYKLNLGAGVIK